MKRVAVVVLAGLAAALGVAVPAQAKGLVAITCGGSHIAQVDPIVAWNQPLSAHNHNFAGNRSTTHNSTVSSLMGAESTCKVGSDKVSFWVPAMVAPSGATVPMAANTQYRLDNITTGTVTKPPDGLRFIFGNANNLNPNATAGQWVCSGVANPEKMTIPTSCPAGATGIHVAIYPHFGCWDGVNTGPGLGTSGGPPDAISHVRLPAACTNGVQIPRVSFILRYPLAAVGGRLSSDPAGVPGGTSLHIDYIGNSGQDATGRDFATRVNEMCLNFVPGSAPPVGNAATTCVETATGALKRISDNAIVLEGVAPSAPPFLFDDGFDGDLSKWTVMSGSPTTEAGKAVLSNTFPNSRIRADDTFSLAGRTVTAFGVDAPVGSNNDASKDRALVVEDTANAAQKVMFKISESKLFAQVSPPNTQTFVPYSPAAHANLRVRESAGTLFWETSPDGTTWSVMRQAPAPSWVANSSVLDLRSGAYYANGHDPFSATRIDRVTVSQ